MRLFFMFLLYIQVQIFGMRQILERYCDWDKFFVNNEYVNNKGKIIYESPNFTKDSLKRYVQKSQYECYGPHKNPKSRKQVCIKIKSKIFFKKAFLEYKGGYF